jgi:hypothetical protein
MIAVEVNSEIELTFLIKGMVSKIPGRLVTDIQLYDHNDGSGKEITGATSLGLELPGTFKYKFENPHVS